jgi:uncharacterized membrane protein YccC
MRLVAGHVTTAVSYLLGAGRNASNDAIIALRQLGQQMARTALLLIPHPSAQIPRMNSLFVWLIELSRHYLRVAVVALFVLVFVRATITTRSDWVGVTIGVALGLCFGLALAFGDKLA